MSLRDAKIVRRELVAPDIVALSLADASGAALPSFDAGAHIDIELGDGLVRQYSLCSLTRWPELYHIAVLREPTSRGGSVAVHALGVGDVVRISAPRNAFPLAVGARKSLLFAGGIGVTPILCMAEALHRDGAEFRMHYCARSAETAAFVAELQSGPFADRVHLHFDDGDAAQRLDIAAALAHGGDVAHIYVCGPGGFIDWVVSAAEAAGYPAANIHREYFNPAPAISSTGDQPFVAEIASTGARFAVPPGETLAQVLLRNGIAIPISCESGVCGTCLTGVQSGVPDHRDYYLSDAEKALGDRILPCCSRAKSEILVLAL
jgi:vanillate O-demethylase ferredoxin subunit